MTDPLIERRARLLGPNVPTFYDEPAHIVRGEGVWLWDAAGRRYLDAYNNVPHVGHCHPKVVAAIAAQAARLNTHTRYLHEGILDYVERLTATLGHGLSQAVMVCTGSEANDVALRMAQAATGRTGLIATDNTYHGNTAAVSALSTRRPPIGGYPPHVRLVPAPDSLAPLGGSAEAQPRAFAANVARAIAELDAAGHGFAGFMLCPFFANEGFPTLAPGFLDPTVAVVRQAGGLILADEVQPGFGRLGTAFWGHEVLGFAPDVVTLGKPMANGHPVGAVVTRPEIMAAFRGAFGYFNTFGGNPVAMAAALATLEVIEEDGLMENARTVGAYALERLGALRHPWLAEVRGRGMFFGAEFVDETGAPATEFAARLVEGLRAEGILAGRIGRAMNTLKFRPPMPFSRAHADLALDSLDRVLVRTEVPR
ncbi:aminotransferase class III-fold pyridoxal phosphate-dependent enzyme [Rhodovulum sp. BSW8]|uniref:Aminotransferase class III-fold pyridoxal phosphate-dependent enzyme n=1 Tax=Rhodovulum visakhapatnamense TaxID=364297 RepID=A0ABS1RDY8_9RHOB|nr:MULTISPECIES: aminotransferase class III-fold pyridoxal phosphate-dependent enzyme [Rhodovulum]MBL3569828.1 aminotransferase class III-fold pyridoxal phosphate-dependent enzyme [Rhodovulum visakhapatnamense]MBL3577714.1 aminotransferase class III-fold pyridoxal phosphate-dependent enzyme [Rhodovulum visakhapatnamense]OLS43577.1 aspartate aminotransferase family protein [Rhodovulum sulfidophilum]RBO51261.1 aminotransferase class III-fold pyridoxal phosphate-dependent enzyme [Rhodovulum sp. BS